MRDAWQTYRGESVGSHGESVGESVSGRSAVGRSAVSGRRWSASLTPCRGGETPLAVLGWRRCFPLPLAVGILTLCPWLSALGRGYLGAACRSDPMPIPRGKSRGYCPWWCCARLWWRPALPSLALVAPLGQRIGVFLSSCPWMPPWGSVFASGLSVSPFLPPWGSEVRLQGFRRLVAALLPPPFFALLEQSRHQQRS